MKSVIPLETQKEFHIESTLNQLPGASCQNAGGSLYTENCMGNVIYSYPLPLPRARELTPDLVLTYQSNSGNGIFGLGFSLNLPSVYRKSDNRIPSYDDTDVFMSSEYGELVLESVRKENGYSVKTFRPVKEKDFVQIQYWKNNEHSYWLFRGCSQTSYYGCDKNSRIFSEDEPENISEWLIGSTVDNHENKILYHYKETDCGRYIESVYYSNYRDCENRELFFFQVDFEYEETRADSSFSYRNGFLTGTKYLCKEIDIIHRIDEVPVKIKDICFSYETHYFISLLKAIKTGGYRRENGTTIYDRRPPVTFEYTSFSPLQQSFGKLDLNMVFNLEDGGQYSFMDIYGEGLDGILYLCKGCAIYYPPLGKGRFGSPERLEYFPKEILSGESEIHLVSLDGNGKYDFYVQHDTGIGYYTLQNGRFSNFRTMGIVPSELYNSDVEWVDMEGDGKSHLLVMNKDAAYYYPSKGNSGFGSPVYAFLPEDFPRESGDTGAVRILFDDILGDGLSHRVRIGNGSVCYWPNLGYGKFGGRVRMDNAPYFENFDARRVYLADLNGSGTKDLIYVYPGKIEIYFNIGGQAFQDRMTLDLPELYTNTDFIRFTDIYGNGCKSLVFGKQKEDIVCYCYHFSAEEKPFLLQKVDLHTGAESHITYKSSVLACLEDKQCGKPWELLCFYPVHTVHEVCHIDRITGCSQHLKYKFKNAWYDFEERAFRGFRILEQWTWEEFPFMDSVMPGCASEGKYLKNLYSTEGIGDARCKILSDCVLEQELYGYNRQTTGDYGEAKLYNKTVYRYGIVEILAPLAGRKGAFLPYVKETVNYVYEGENTPRIHQEIIVETDDYGYPVISAFADYGKECPDAEGQETTQIRVVYAWYAHVKKEIWCLGIPVKEKVIGFTGTCVFKEYEKLRNKVLESAETDGQLISELKWLYWDDALKDVLPFGEVAANRLLHHTEECVIAQDEIESCYKRVGKEWFDARAMDELLKVKGGFFKDGRYWWRKSSVTIYRDRNMFYLPAESITLWYDEDDPLYSQKKIEYDSYGLMAVSERIYVRKGLWNETTACIDYQALQYSRVCDWNGNITESGFNALGEISIYTEYGTEGGGIAGNKPISGYKIMEGEVEDMMEFPQKYLQGRSVFYFADYRAYEKNKKPLCIVLIESADADNEVPPMCHIQYLDGLGGIIETRVKTENGYAVKNRSFYGISGHKLMAYPGCESSGWKYDRGYSGHPVLYQYDMPGRETVIWVPAGLCPRSGKAGYMKMKYIYNAWSEEVYDANRTVKETDLYREYVSHTPGGRLQEKQKEALLKGGDFEYMPVVKYYDCCGRIIRERMRGLDGIYTCISYNVAGLTACVSDARLNEVHCPNMEAVYDLSGDILYYFCADTGGRMIIRNSYGNVIRISDSNGNITGKEYDHLQRIRQVYVEGTGITEKFIYGEDCEDAGNGNCTGRLVSYYNQSGVVHYKSYDIHGFCTSKSTRFLKEYTIPTDWRNDNEPESEEWAESFRYDRLGNLTDRIYPGGIGEKRRYNISGYLNDLSFDINDEKTEILTHALYYPDGSIKKRSFGNNTESFYMQDEYTRRRKTAVLKRADGKTLLGFYYIYDPAGNISYLCDEAEFPAGISIAPGERDYEYDALYQLTGCNARESVFCEDRIDIIPYTERHTYDSSGNLVRTQRTNKMRETIRDITIQDRSNRIKQIDGNECRYDGNGNLLELQNGTSMQWDWDNRLITTEIVYVDGSSVKEFYFYGHDGTRTRKVSVRGDSITEKYYFGGLEVTREDRQTQIKICATGGESLFAEIILTETSSPDISYKYQDHVNSVVMELDREGNVLTWEEFYSYGESALFLGCEAAPKEYRYAGKESDESSGLYYFGARYYDGIRFISGDTVDYIVPDSFLGINLYAYCRNNPLKYKDPDGHCIHYFSNIQFEYQMNEDSGLFDKNRTVNKHLIHNDTEFKTEWSGISKADSVVIINTHGNPRSIEWEDGSNTTNTRFLGDIEANGKIASVITLSCRGDYLYKRYKKNEDGSYSKDPQGIYVKLPDGTYTKNVSLTIRTDNTVPGGEVAQTRLSEKILEKISPDGCVIASKLTVYGGPNRPDKAPSTNKYNGSFKLRKKGEKSLKVGQKVTIVDLYDQLPKRPVIQEPAEPVDLPLKDIPPIKPPDAPANRRNSRRHVPPSMQRYFRALHASNISISPERCRELIRRPTLSRLAGGSYTNISSFRINQPHKPHPPLTPLSPNQGGAPRRKHNLNKNFK